MEGVEEVDSEVGHADRGEGKEEIGVEGTGPTQEGLSLIHISEPTSSILPTIRWPTPNL